MSCIYSTNSPFLVRHRYKIPTEHSVASVWGAQGLELFFRADDSNVWSLLLYFTKILLLLASCLRHCLPQNQQHYLPDNKAWIIPRRDTIAHAEWDLPELVILWSWEGLLLDAEQQLLITVLSCTDPEQWDNHSETGQCYMPSCRRCRRCLLTNSLLKRRDTLAKDM